jgi:hypothetical protein
MMVEPKKFTNPFPGLRPFETDEYRLFFGREGQSDALITRLQRARFLGVVGTSGSGKSSLVRAGLLPALRGGMMAGAGSGWRISIMRPGSDPFGNLAHSLAENGVLPEAGGGLPPAEGEAVIEAQLRRGSLGLVDAVKHARLAEHEKLLVVVDQFEELFRFRAARAATSTADDASAFVKLLLEAAQQRELSIYVVLTMRSDFLGDCAQFQGLPEAINDGQYLIPRMTRDERRMAVTGPVGVTRGKISEPLINRLLNDVGDNPDQLPILQHALMRTWDYWAAHRRNGEPIGLEHYEKIGTMADALSLHADEAWDELPDERSRRVAEKLFKSLTEKGADNREIRRPTRLSEIAAAAEVSEPELVAVIDVFRRAGRSFLMPPAGVALSSETVIDISHESLIRNWKRLQTWVDEEAQSSRVYRRLGEAAVLHQEGSEGLLQDPALQIALDWRDKNKPNAAWAERYHAQFDQSVAYLEQSRIARDAALAERERQRNAELERERREREQAERFAAEQAHSARRLRWLAVGMAVMFLLALGTAAYGLHARNDAKQAERVAIIAQAEALRQEGIASASLANEKRNTSQLIIEKQAKQDALDDAKKQTVKAEKAKELADAQTRLASDRALKEKKAREDAAVAQKAELLAGKTNQSFRHATAYRQQGAPEKAVQEFQAAVEGYQKSKNLDGLADTYVALGELSLELRPNLDGTSDSVDAAARRKEFAQTEEEAVKYLVAAATTYRRMSPPNHPAAAQAFVKLGKAIAAPTYHGHGAPSEDERKADELRERKGVEQYEEALVDFEAAGDAAAAQALLMEITQFYGKSKDGADKRKAIQANEKMLASVWFKEHSSQTRERLIDIAKQYFSIKDTAHAEAYVTQALKIPESAEESWEPSEELMKMSEFLDKELNDKESARLYLERAAKFPPQPPDPDQQAEKRAGLFFEIGKRFDAWSESKQTAIGYFERSAAVYRELGKRDAEADKLREIADWFTEKCEPAGTGSDTKSEAQSSCDTALQYWNRVLAIYKATGDQTKQGDAVVGMAGVYDHVGDKQRVIDTYKQALTLFESKEQMKRADALSQIAKVQIALGENQQALETYGQVLPLLESRGKELDRAHTLSDIAKLQVLMNQPQQAIDSYQQALLIVDRDRNGGDAQTFLSLTQRDMHKLYESMRRQKNK